MNHDSDNLNEAILRRTRGGLCAALFSVASVSAAFAQQSGPTPQIDNIAKRLPGQEAQAPDEVALPALEGEGAAAAAAGAFLLVGVNVVGATVLSPEEIGALYEPYVARNVGYAELAALAEAITQAYRDRGYFLSRAVIPPQDVDSGVITVRISEGYVSEVAFVDDRDARLEDYFRHVLAEQPARLAPLERALSLISDLQGVELVRSDVELMDGDAYRLLIETRRDRISGQLYADNRGTKAIGRHQVYAQIGANSLVRTGDRLSFGVFTTPGDINELVYAEGSYVAPINHLGTTFRIHGSRSSAEAGAALAPFEIASGSKQIKGEISHPLIRRRALNLWAYVSFEARDSFEDNFGASTFDDRLRIVRARVAFSKSDRWRGVSGGTVRASRGVDLFGANDRNDIRSRSDADGTFTKFDLDFYRVQQISDAISIYAAFKGQYALDPLPLVEEYSHGGAAYGRAYDYGALFGDHAAASTVELRYVRNVSAPAVDAIQAFAFYDAASVWNKVGSGQERQDALVSAGGGLTFTLFNNVSATYTAAKPLVDRPATGDRGLRHFFSVSAQF